MISGARAGTMTWLRRLAARAMAQDLTAFVIPEIGFAAHSGLDLEAAGLRIVTTPRHASVLVITGLLPPGLAQASAVIYAQMPRPRLILSIGNHNGPLPLPPFDATAPAEQSAISDAVDQLRQHLRANAFSEQTSDFEAAALHSQTEYVCPMHPEVTEQEPGTCPICGMDLVPRDRAADADDHSGHMHHNGHAHQQHDEHSHDQSGMNQDSGGHDHDHGGMDDFMSMVAMTKDIARSPDGLPMERMETPVGPLFPGLPAGLGLTFVLDGDAVAEIQLRTGYVGRAITSIVAGPALDLPDRMEEIEPLLPGVYKILAMRALEDIAGITPDESTRLRRQTILKAERARSHLNWLARLALLLGDHQLCRRATSLEIALARYLSNTSDGGSDLVEDASRLIDRVRRTQLLRHRLEGIGTISAAQLEDATGPVARAGSGNRRDTDAFDRFQVRLAELAQDFEFARDRVPARISDSAINSDISGSSVTEIETPRGRATLHLQVEDGMVTSVHLETPSMRNAMFLETVALKHEFADALVAIASLDLSPWEIDL